MTHVAVGRPDFYARIPDHQSLLLWKDDLSVGPVPRKAMLPELSRIRDAFWNVPWALKKTQVSSVVRDREFHELSGELAIWYGENRREVLMLAAVLYFLNAELPVWLVAAGGTLGTLTCGPDDCAAAFERRQSITDETRRELRQLWEAYTAPDPAGLNAIAASGTSLSAKIAARVLQEYPSTDTGLSLTEETLLEKVSDGESVI